MPVTIIKPTCLCWFSSIIKDTGTISNWFQRMLNEASNGTVLTAIEHCSIRLHVHKYMHCQKAFINERLIIDCWNMTEIALISTAKILCS